MPARQDNAKASSRRGHQSLACFVYVAQPPPSVFSGRLLASLGSVTHEATVVRASRRGIPDVSEHGQPRTASRQAVAPCTVQPPKQDLHQTAWPCRTICRYNTGLVRPAVLRVPLSRLAKRQFVRLLDLVFEREVVLFWLLIRFRCPIRTLRKLRLTQLWLS